jgi:hypothetical protein
VQSVNGPAVTIIKGYQLPGTTNGLNAVRCVYLGNGATLSGFTLTNGATLLSDGFGGGVFCASTSCLVTNCEIIGNAAYAGGGGAYYGTLVNCTLIGNSAAPPDIGNGGGAYNSTLIDCVLARNFSGYNGGGASGGTLINCTVVGNVSGAANGGASGTLKNCIVYYNFSYDTSADTGGGGNVTNCCTSFAVTFAGANNFTNPPLFVNLSAGDFHLNAASPCINAGHNSFITNSTDLDGNPRIVGGVVDIGAYEFQSPLHFVALNSTNPVSPYTTWLTAATNIQDAIDASTNGDLILVTNGLYQTGGRVMYGTNRVAVAKPVTVQSINGPAVTIIQGYQIPGSTNGDAAIRCAYLTNGAALAGFTLTNGATQTSFPGGGVTCESYTGSIVTNCVLINNSAFASGGGASGGTLNNCTIIGNHAASNSGGVAGAVLNNCIICSNSASLGGGANSCQLYNCTIMGNQADQGGGTYNSTLVNCMITGNSANASGFGGGGGAYQSMLFNCTVTGNRAYGSQGGGTYNSTLYNSIVYYNTSFTSYPNYAGGLLNNCCATPLPASGGGNVANDPLFVNQTGGDFHLQTNSPCINSGNNGYASGTDDLDGNPRIVGGTVDIGAYEFQAPVSRISYAWLQQYKLPINTNTDSSDADGDGMNNWQEWIAGTDPTNPSSVLEMLAPASTNNPSGLVVSWQSVNTRTYYLQRSTNLTAEPAFSSIQSNIVGQAGTTSYMDTNASGSGPCFYRVGVQ